jgi:anti-sigma regulatory factor (Ser/Thr protein kinase)
MVTDALPSVAQDARDAAEMLVSEVVTNCIRHTTSDFEVTIRIATGVVRVEVTDWGGGEPVVRNPEPSEPNGRGLQIVEMLSNRWGIERGIDRNADPLPGGPSKTVWFEIVLQPA